MVNSYGVTPAVFEMVGFESRLINKLIDKSAVVQSQTEHRICYCTVKENGELKLKCINIVVSLHLQVLHSLNADI